MINAPIGLAGKVASLVPNVLPQATAAATTSRIVCLSNMVCPISSSPQAWRFVFSSGGKEIYRSFVQCCIFA